MTQDAKPATAGQTSGKAPDWYAIGSNPNDQAYRPVSHFVDRALGQSGLGFGRV